MIGCDYFGFDLMTLNKNCSVLILALNLLLVLMERDFFFLGLGREAGESDSPATYKLCINFKMIFFSPWSMSLFLNVQDFGASERGKKPVQSAKGQPVVSRDQKENPDVHVWEEDDVDSVKVHVTTDLIQNIVLPCWNHA